MRRSRSTTSIAVALAAAALAPAASAAPLKLGFYDQSYQTAEPAQFWADAAVLRPQLLRYTLSWADVAPRRPAAQRNPADAAYRWGAIDALVRDAAAHQVPVLLTVTGTPRWAIKRPGYRVWGRYAIPNTTLYRNFVAAAAQRYSGTYAPAGAPALPRVTRWQIWNEPNKYLYPHRTDRRGNFQRGGPITVARDYTALLNGAYAELKRRSRANTVVLGGAAYSNFYRAELAPLNWLRRLRASRARFDVVALHPYNSIPRLGLRQGVGSPGPNVYVGNFARAIREVDRLWPGRRYRIWLTEFGIQSFPDRFLGVSQAAQARYLQASISTFKRRYKRVEAILWFLVKDERNLTGWQSGLRAADGRQKPAWKAWLAVRGR